MNKSKKLNELSVLASLVTATVFIVSADLARAQQEDSKEFQKWKAFVTNPPFIEELLFSVTDTMPLPTVAHSKANEEYHYFAMWSDGKFFIKNIPHPAKKFMNNEVSDGSLPAFCVGDDYYGFVMHHQYFSTTNRFFDIKAAAKTNAILSAIYRLGIYELADLLNMGIVGFHPRELQWAGLACWGETALFSTKVNGALFLNDAGMPAGAKLRYGGFNYKTQYRYDEAFSSYIPVEIVHSSDKMDGTVTRRKRWKIHHIKLSDGPIPQARFRIDFRDTGEQARIVTQEGPLTILHGPDGATVIGPPQYGLGASRKTQFGWTVYIGGFMILSLALVYSLYRGSKPQ